MECNRAGAHAAGALWLAILGCVGRQADHDEATSSGDENASDGNAQDTSAQDTSAGDTSADETSPGTSGTGDEPECISAMCGDGVVGLDEECDDANTDDRDGCTAACRRPAPSVRTAIDGRVADAAVDADGSLVLVGGVPTVVTRLAPDGVELWSTALDTPHETVRVVALHVGTEITVVADGPDTNFGTGSIWRIAPDGSTQERSDDPSDRYYVDAVVDPTADIFLLLGSGQWLGASVERQTREGTAVWARNIAEEGAMSLQSIAVVSDDVLFAAGGIPEPWEAVVVRVTPDDVGTTTLPAAEYPDAFLGSVTPDGAGGAIASGGSRADSITARVDSDGELLWVSSCSAAGAFARELELVDDRVVLYGQRHKPEPDCGDVCSGAHFAWVQHLDLDGTVLASDSLVGEEEYPYDVALAVRRADSGELTVVGQSSGAAGFVAAFPW